VQVKNQNRKGKKQVEETKGVSAVNLATPGASGAGAKKSSAGKKDKKESVVAPVAQAFSSMNQSISMPQQNQINQATAPIGSSRKPYLQPPQVNQPKAKNIQQSLNSK
jgi:hypothetical protein